MKNRKEINLLLFDRVSRCTLKIYIVIDRMKNRRKAASAVKMQP